MNWRKTAPAWTPHSTSTGGTISPLESTFTESSNPLVPHDLPRLVTVFVREFHRQALEVGTDESLRRRRISPMIPAIELCRQEDHQLAVVHELLDSESSSAQRAE